MTEPSRQHDAAALRRITDVTIGHYDRMADDYWAGTRDHDVSQNRTALIDAIEGSRHIRSSIWAAGRGAT